MHTIQCIVLFCVESCVVHVFFCRRRTILSNNEKYLIFLFITTKVDAVVIIKYMVLVKVEHCSNITTGIDIKDKLCVSHWHDDQSWKQSGGLHNGIFKMSNMLYLKVKIVIMVWLWRCFPFAVVVTKGS